MTVPTLREWRSRSRRPIPDNSVNGSTWVHLDAPFGGFEQLSLGRELGIHALEHYTELKGAFISTAQRQVTA